MPLITTGQYYGRGCNPTKGGPFCRRTPLRILLPRVVEACDAEFREKLPPVTTGPEAQVMMLAGRTVGGFSEEITFPTRILAEDTSERVSVD